jgi:hypothetical protein
MRQQWGKEVSRSNEGRNDMEENQEEKKVRRSFKPEQKCEILKDIHRRVYFSRRVREQRTYPDEIILAAKQSRSP